MKSDATAVDAYLAELPPDRRKAIQAVRKVIRANLDKGYKEIVQYGAIGYVVPHSVYPPGYHCDPKQPLPFAGLASQKNHMAIYLMCVYMDDAHEQWFRDAWAKTGKKLDMGKSCVRFKKIEDVPLDVIGKAIKRVPAKKFVAHYEATRKAMSERRGASAANSSRSTKAAKKSGAKKTTARRVARKKVGNATRKSSKKA